MRKALVAAVLSAATLFSVPALAADSDSRMAVGGDAMFVLPIGDFSDATGAQLGVLGRFGYRVIPQLEITGRAGYIYGFSKSTEVGPVKSDVGASVIPLWGGARYFFFEHTPTAGPYAGAELGFNFINYRASVSGAGVADVDGDKSYTRFGFSAFGGYVISPDLPIDLRGQFIHYNLIGKGDESAAIGLGISVGYTYQL
ncbi:porin family protein [Pendulispora brunnea]|uniref:Porin family protein n=1 Tax=Pendulispora brunnea TaxID=2905690 RepID=A0ABZ2KMU6_9BACT